MKQLLYIIIVVLATATPLASQAQDKGRGKNWTNEMLELKHEFIVSETAMTQKQRDQFMPLYEAMEKEIFAVNRDARNQAQKVQNKNATDAEYEAAARAMSQVKTKEGEIEKRYFEKYAKILSKKQLFQLKQAEIKFSRQMLTKGKGNNKN